MRIADIFKSGPDPVFSFEFFPPKGEKGRDALLATIADLEDLAPSFVSVTYGAGGSTRDRTLELVSYIKNRVGIEAMAHLTCVGATRDEISGVLDALESASIENVIALRGDPPQDADDFVQLMTPIIKSYMTDAGSEAANLGVQTMGGHGYIEEWGMEQLVRDARIAQIYEGTNGIQALDLAGRKLGAHFGRCGDEEFHRRVRADDGADIAPVEDRALGVAGRVGGEAPLEREQHCAHLLDGRDLGGGDRGLIP